MPKFQAAIFDVDGVLVDSPHEKAWRAIPGSEPSQCSCAFHPL